ncbi:unnamed protein product [Soboliphyme baturini]|uniref:UBFD1 PH-like C-terminal domain-containing protein n=1 Tax=Soboliphyme baturini TaxID=241478 RepID=A0A3P8GRR0_9BILA|nr:unnamed protein product [Soboliphyme baturini]
MFECRVVCASFRSFPILFYAGECFELKRFQDPLPPTPICGLVNKLGNKVRLTFKLELDQVWIGTKERTDKIMMNQIRNVISEPIDGHEDYCIMALQLGTTDASNYWLYWVPAQYVDAIRQAILGP